jgi:flagellar FliL protein
MAETQATGEPQVAPAGTARPKRRRLGWIIICLVSIVAGGALPMVLGAYQLIGGAQQSKKKSAAEREQVTVQFGEVAVNLSEARMTRYLRVKIILIVDSEDAKELNKQLDKRKPMMKDWLISHLAGKSMKDVGGTVGVKRVQREIQDRFEELLFPHGDSVPFEVLFEEFVVQ